MPKCEEEPGAYSTKKLRQRPDVAYQSKQIILILAEAVPLGELRQIRDGLPAEFDGLFELISSEPAPP